jgi:hypothetical protein
MPCDQVHRLLTRFVVYYFSYVVRPRCLGRGGPKVKFEGGHSLRTAKLMEFQYGEIIFFTLTFKS